MSQINKATKIPHVYIYLNEKYLTQLKATVRGSGELLLYFIASPLTGDKSQLQFKL